MKQTMIRYIAVSIILTITISYSCFSFAQESLNIKDTINSAVEMYERGDFEESVQEFEKVIDSGFVNGSVYYDLGNAYYRIGKKGNALAAYLQARKYLPRDPDLKANIAFIQESLVDNLDVNLVKPEWQLFFFWTDSLNKKETLYISAILLSLSFILFFLSFFIEAKTGLRISSSVVLIFALISSIGTVTKLSTDQAWGAVNVANAKVYSGPDSKSNTVLFELKDASPVVITKEDQDWFQIELSDSKKGWINSSDVKTFAAKYKN